MKSIPRTIYDLFNSKHRYVVPIFQRQYVWSREDQWEPFWEDILSKTLDRLEQKESSPHFMGAMVFEQVKSFGNQIHAHTVIDGQQRLTTLQIFLAALRNVVRTYELDEYVDEISSHITNKGIIDDQLSDDGRKIELYKVWTTKADQKQFCDVIDAVSREKLEEKYPPVKERRKIKPRPSMVEAYLYFQEALEEYFNDPELSASIAERVAALNQALNNDLQVVSIELEDKDNPQVIFETLNARGEPLLPSDLLRNYIFRRAELKKENQNLLYNRYWRIFEEEFWRFEEKQGRLKRARIDLFMQHFLALKKAADVNVGHLFEEYKNWIKNQNPYPTIEAELEDLVRYADAFYQLIDQNNSSLFGDFGKRLNTIDVRTIYPLLLFLLADSNLPEAELIRAGKILESYLIRRAVCGKTTKNYNKSFLLIMRELQTTGVSVDALERLLLGFTGEAGVFPTDEEFEAAWLSNPVYELLGPKKVELILSSIEDALHTEFHEEITIHSHLTVEHIMPQKWETNWALPAPEGAAEADAATLPALPDNQAAARRDKIIQTFGNLTLLIQKLNSSVSNGSFENKKAQITGNSVLRLNRYFIDLETWDEAAIERRGRKLFEIARRIWQYPGN